MACCLRWLTRETNRTPILGSSIFQTTPACAQYGLIGDLRGFMTLRTILAQPFQSLTPYSRRGACPHGRGQGPAGAAAAGAARTPWNRLQVGSDMRSFSHQPCLCRITREVAPPPPPRMHRHPTILSFGTPESRSRSFLLPARNP